MWPFGQRTATSTGQDNLGQRGESLAKSFLKKQGLKILACNYRCPAGEADIIALQKPTGKGLPETIVFAEVKTRASDRYASPASAVDAAKRKHIQAVANYYLAGRDTTGLATRFDIIAIVMPPDQPVRIEHITDAF